MIRNPVPFLLMLSLAGTVPVASLAQDAFPDAALAGGDAAAPAGAVHKPHPRRATAAAADLTESDLPGGALPPLLAVPHPARPKARPAAPQKVTISAANTAANLAYDPSPLTAAPVSAAPIATTPIAVATAPLTHVVSAPIGQPVAPAPEIASPGPANPAPAPLTPSQYAPHPGPLPLAQPLPSQPAFPQPQFQQPQFSQPMSPVLPRQPVATQPPAHPVAQATPAVPAPHVLGGLNSLTVETGMGRVVQLGAGAASVFAADPKVAEVRPAAANSLFIFGVSPGRTSVAALDANGAPIAQYDVIVMPSSYGAAAARTSIGHLVPGANVKIETESGNMVVSGTVSSPADAEKVMNIVKGFTPSTVTTINNLNVSSGTQVNLRVRIVEMDRSLTRDLGVSWTALGSLGKYAAIGFVSSNPLVSAATAGASAALGSTGTGGGYNFSGSSGSANINPMIDALAQDQLVHMLAEPNLTAMSGQTASFLVGGEFPIPVAQQNNTVTIEFKQFGVSLAFVPTVMNDGHISLKVRPEVSSLSTQGAIQLTASNASIQIPALSVRRAETTVELGSGQSFAIAGLLQDNATLTANGLPFLGDLPILGALFRSDNFQHNQTELVIIVTPYIVRPVTETAALHMPDETWKAPSDLERILLLRQGAASRDGTTPVAAGAAPPTRIPGNAGFVVQ